MLTLETDRLLLVPTPLAVMRERLRRADFVADLPLGPAGDSPEGWLTVHFPAEWPGEDALAMLPIWIARQERLPDPAPWCDGIVVRREDSLAVGSMGFKARPDVTGTVEIGYAVNASLRGRGYATEMASALAAWALRRPEVRRVTAECLEANPASARVLEKAGFGRVGRRAGEDGELLLWERRAAVMERTPPASNGAVIGLRNQPLESS